MCFYLYKRVKGYTLDFMWVNILEQYKKFITVTNSSKGVSDTWGQGGKYSHVLSYSLHFGS